MLDNIKHTIKVLPWKGYKAAISLTFDDGDKSQSEIAVPYLNERGIKATFFLTVNMLTNEEAWIQAVKNGHEIGNHSMNHICPLETDIPDVKEETLSSQKILSKKFNTRVLSYAYPYTFTTPEIIDELRNTHLSARVGQDEPVHMKASYTPDWLNIPSVITFTDFPLKVYTDWIDESLKQEAWTVFMIHGIEIPDCGFEPIDIEIFTGILDYLKNPDIWVAPYGTVCAYWMAQKIFQNSKQSSTSNGVEYSWYIPSVFPEGTNLKIELENVEGKYELLQYGENLNADSNNIYTISFDASSLEFRYVK